MTSPALQPWKTYLDRLGEPDRTLMLRDLRMFVWLAGLSLDDAPLLREPQRRVHAQAR